MGELSDGIVSQAVHQGVQDRRVRTKDRTANVGNRFFEGMLAAHRGTADVAGIDWRSAVYRKVTEAAKSNPGLSVARMVELGRVSRSSFYRFDGEAGGVRNQGMDLRDALQRIALEMPSYGRPRITAEDRKSTRLNSS